MKDRCLHSPTLIKNQIINKNGNFIRIYAYKCVKCGLLRTIELNGNIMIGDTQWLFPGKTLKRVI